MGIPKAAIFDIDGTLLDSNDAHAWCYVSAVQSELQQTCRFERVRRLIGMGGDHLVPALLGISEDSPEGKAVARAKKECLNARLPSLRAFPKARELLEALRSRGIQIAVASSAKKDELDQYLRIVGIKDLVKTEVAAGDAQSSKPEPDVVCAALWQLRLPSEDVLMVGDTPYDIQAAARAGVRTVALRCGGWTDEDLRGAIAFYDDPADLLDRLEASPFFQAAFPASGESARTG